MYRSSLTLAFVVLYSAAAAASDIYVAPGGITRHQRTSMCVRHRPIGNSLTRSPVTDISGLLMVMGRALPIAHLHRSMASTDRPTPRNQPMSNARPSIRSDTTRRSVATLPIVTTVRIVTTRRNATMRWNTRRGRLCPYPTVRARDATTAMAGGSPAIKAAGIARVRCDCGDDT